MKTYLQKSGETTTQLNGAKRAIKMFAILTVAVMTTFTACTDYDNSLNNAEDRLDKVEQTIPSINQQINTINSSINTLKSLQSEVNNLAERVSTLESDTSSKTEINELREGLENAKRDLGKKITDLETYVNGDFKNDIEEWVNTTFATLKHYEELQDLIAEIRTQIGTTKNEITKAYTEAIEKAIEATEESIKGWVNELLTEGYYDIATIDKMIEDLQSTDESLQKQINAQQEALELAKEELTSAYEEAIRKVIEDNNGIITEAIASAVQSVIDNVNTELQNIKNNISLLQQEIANIKSKINSIDKQIENINDSITRLEKTDKTLEGYIDTLRDKANSLQNQIDANDVETKKELNTIKTLINALEAKDIELDKKIADLKTYVDNEILSTQNWANATFATLEQYQTIQTTIAEIRTLIDTTKDEITEVYTQAIEEAIDATEESMKNWVNELLAEGYYNTAEVDAKLSALETEDANLLKQIQDQQEALDEAVQNLTTAYETAINEAIETNNGVIDQKISDAIQRTIKSIDSQLTTINSNISAIQQEIANIKSKINSIDKQIENINDSITRLEKTDKTLEGYIDTLRDKANSLQNQIDANDVETKKELNTIKTLINALEAKDIELDKKIADLKTYVDNEILSTQNWANATFATLEQYQTIQTTIAEIRTLIDTTKDEITEVYTQAIEEAIDATEESMKNWVNELLAEGYYNTAEVDAKLSALETEDANLLKQIQDQQEALDEAVQNLTTAYETAINEAIETNNGVIDQKISDAIQRTIKSIDSQLTTINNNISAIQKEIEDIKNSIAAIEKEIEDINNLIDELDERLNGLQTTDADIINQITNQLIALEQIRTDLTTAYEAAIKRAIEENNGAINTEIAKAITEAVEDIERRLNNVSASIKNIEDELEALKENFTSRIQSIRFLPEYADGKVLFNSLETTADLCFIISPSKLAAVVASTYSKNSQVVTAWISRTQTTRAADMPMSVTVTSVEGSESGLLTVSVDISSLAEGYWDGFQNANMFIRIQDGNNDIISEMIPILFENK